MLGKVTFFSAIRSRSFCIIRKTTPKYNLENITTKYTVEVKNRFSILQVDGKNPKDLWINIHYSVIETAEKWIKKLRRGKLQNV